MDRFSYLRQFAPKLLDHIEFETPKTQVSQGNDLLKAVKLLRKLNKNNQRTIPMNAPTAFIPKKLKKLVICNGKINKRAWECALLTKIRDDIKTGNLIVKRSKRFGHFDNFFISNTQWASQRKKFFKKSGLPDDPKKLRAFFTRRLNKAFDDFLNSHQDNVYATVKEDRWALSVDPADTFTVEEKQALHRLKAWLSKRMRSIKLPQLLIEVDNDLQFTKKFMLPTQQQSRDANDICEILVSIMAYGCFIGPATMPHLTKGVTYDQIRRVADWQLTQDAQRAVLALIVNAITRLDITKRWGEGRTSSSDGQRYSYKRKSLHQTYSTKYSDFALEFYTFIADNYAPFYSLPYECTNRDAPYVFDGVVYNESDLALEEHYTGFDDHPYRKLL